MAVRDLIDVPSARPPRVGEEHAGLLLSKERARALFHRGARELAVMVKGGHEGGKDGVADGDGLAPSRERAA